MTQRYIIMHINNSSGSRWGGGGGTGVRSQVLLCFFFRETPYDFKDISGVVEGVEDCLDPVIPHTCTQ